MDENVPLSLKKIINSLGHEAITLKDENQLGIKNGEVAELSININATIITLDSDFLSIKKLLQENCRIIYIKIHPRDPVIIGQIIKTHLEQAVNKLNIPGKIILSENDIKFENP